MTQRKRATLFALSLVLFAGCNDSDSTVREQELDPWVGREVCVTCHEAEGASWSNSHHDLAMQEPTETTVLGDFSGSTFEYNGVESRFFRKDGGFHVATDGPDGTLTEYPIAYVFGVEPLQQYLIEFPGGRFQALNVCWDTRPSEEGGQRWFHLYPDEAIGYDDPLHWTGPYQNWNHMCAECHTTALRKNFDPETLSFNTQWKELDVSCEACHGPGRQHIRWTEDGADDRLKGFKERLPSDHVWEIDPVTGIARRDPPLQQDLVLRTCAPCHSRRSTIHFGGEPGEPLLSNFLPRRIEEPLYFADGQIREEVYVYGSFTQSRMFQAGVTCVDCHDPHSLGLKSPGDGVCLQCHETSRFASPGHHFHAADSAGASCVSCHMPSRNYMVVDPRADHSFRIPRPDLTEKIGVPNSCNGCHDQRPAQWAAEKIRSWYGEPAGHYGQVLNDGARSLSGSGQRLIQLAKDDSLAPIIRATAVALLGNNMGPSAFGAVTEGLGDSSPEVRLAALNALESAPADLLIRVAAPSLQDPIRAVRMSAARLLVPVANQVPPALSGAFQRALREYWEAQEVNADRAEAQLNLGSLQSTTGQYSAAEASYLRALEIVPASPVAYVNLADLYRTSDRDAEGEAVLRRGLAQAPAGGVLHHALGLFLVRSGRADEGRRELEQAVLAEPNNSRFNYVYAVALHSNGEVDKALSHLERVLANRPEDRQLLSALISFYRDAGRLEEARRHALTMVRMDPKDESAVRLLDSLQ